MNIGIITLPLNVNYGGILQAYALQTVLKKMGHKVEVLEEPKKDSKTPLFVYIKRIVKKCLGKKSIINYNGFMKKWEPIVSKDILRFINLYIKKRIIPFDDLKETDFEAYVVGSDQIWRPKYCSNILHSYLDFTKGWNIKRIAYAASFGINTWSYTEKETEICKSLIKQFNLVTVRELSAVGLCRKYLDINAINVLDPTFLLDKCEYQRLIADYKVSNSHFIFSYLLDETKEKLGLLEKISMIKELPIHKIKLENDLSKLSGKKLAKLRYPSIQQWLAAFAQADFILTDSFHGTVFSIIFNKPFISIANKGRGITRFHSLLKVFGLENRLIFEEQGISKEMLSESIDFNKINAIMSAERNKSFKLLKEQL